MRADSSKLCLTMWLTGSLALAVFAQTAMAALPQQTSVTKDGITWTFAQPAPVGQFVNGDYYVVGPVTVTSISPAPQTAAPFMNGSVKNLPTPDGKSGFDRRLNDGVDESFWFNAQWRVYAPFTLQPGDSLVSSRSLTDAQYHNVPELFAGSSTNISPVASFSILTVVSSEASADAFRPSYCDRNQTIYHANNLNRSLLPSLAPPNPSGTPALATFEGYLRRPWVDLSPFTFDVAAEYMPSYAQRIAFVDSYAGLLLSLDFPAEQKVNLTNYFVQYGIDLHGCLAAGHSWPAFGGHRSGRKMPIVVAGLLLGDTAMQNVSTLYPDSFGEDMQTLYVNQLPPAGKYTQAWQGASVIYGGHYGVHADGTPVDTEQNWLYAPYEHLQPALWPLLTPTEQLGEAYRRCCTSNSWVGEALAMRLMGAQGVWNHPAFFDYVDRWMTEDDNLAVQAILQQSGFDYTVDWQRQGQTAAFLQGEYPQNTFIDDMWHAYRALVPQADTTPPTTPAGLTAVAFSASQINLIWNPSTDNVGVTGYKIYRNGVAVASSATYQYYDTGLAPGLPYTYTISAFDAAGNNSAQSSSASATTPGTPDTIPPSVPTGLTAAPDSLTSVGLSWNASTDNIGVTGYNIYRNGTKVGATADTSYTDTGLTPNTRFTYTVAAYDLSGNTSAQSAAAIVTTVPGSAIHVVHATLCIKQTITTTSPLICTIPVSRAGNTLVVAWLSYRANGPLASVSDSAGNPYSLVSGTRTVNSEMWYAHDVRAGATTVSLYPANDNERGPAVIYEVFGVNTADRGAGLDSPGEANPVGALVTLASAPELIIASAVPTNSMGNLVAGSAFATDSTYDANAWAHLITTAPGTYQPQWTAANPGAYQASTASFKYVAPAKAVTSGLSYSRITHLFTGTVTITNTSAGALTGPFQVVFDGLPASVTLTNASGTMLGAPYIQINQMSLAAGQSASASLVISNPSNVPLTGTMTVHGTNF